MNLELDKLSSRLQLPKPVQNIHPTSCSPRSGPYSIFQVPYTTLVSNVNQINSPRTKYNFLLAEANLTLYMNTYFVALCNLCSQLYDFPTCLNLASSQSMWRCKFWNLQACTPTSCSFHHRRNFDFQNLGGKEASVTFC